MEWKFSDIQAAGHKFILGESGEKLPALIDEGDGFVLKAMQNPPRGARELQFYQQVWGYAAPCSYEEKLDLQEMQSFLPHFVGTVERDGVSYMKLSNLTYGLHRPCVMDLKMGRVTYKHDASAEKIAAESKKFPPSRNLGFQITGMVVYDRDNDSFERYSKEYNRSLTEDTIVTKGLNLFFKLGEDSSKQHLLPSLLNKLQKLEAWFNRQKRFSFIASSILVAYDGYVGNTADTIGAKISNGSLHGGSCDIKSSWQSILPHNQMLNQRNCLISSPVPSGLITSSLVGPRQDGGLSRSGGYHANHISSTYNTNDIPLGSMGDMVEMNANLGDICRKQNNNSVVKAKLGDFSLQSDVCDSTSQGDLRLYFIDFAHVSPSEAVDDNVLFGIRKLISHVEAMMR